MNVHYFQPVNSHVTQQSSLLANQQNQLNHVRTKMVDFRMIRDNKRRKTVQEYGPERFRINMVRKSKIIPREIKVLPVIFLYRPLNKDPLIYTVFMVPYDVYKLVHSIDKQCIVLNLDCIQKGASKHTHQFWNTCTSTYLWHIFTLLYSWNTKCLISLKSCTIIFLYFNMYYRKMPWNYVPK